MLQKLLLQLTQDKIQQPDEIARALDTSPELVRQMTEQLVARGYLENRAAAECETVCSHCAQQMTCQAGKPATTLWSLTAKGLQAVKKRQSTNSSQP